MLRILNNHMYEAVLKQERDSQLVVIKISNPARTQHPEAWRYHNIVCDDVTEANRAKYPLQYATKGVIVPTRAMVWQALEFATYQDPHVSLNKYVVSCDAGISRSAAIAWGILLHRFKNIEAATSKLFQVNPYAHPNEDMLRYAYQYVLSLSRGVKYADTSITSDLEQRAIDHVAKVRDKVWASLNVLKKSEL